MLLRNVFTKTIRDLRWPTFWVAIGMLAMTAYFAILFPTYKSIFDFESMFGKLPPAAKALMGASIANLSTLTGFLHLELFSMILPATAIAYAAGIASGFTAGEESRGTIDVLLSYPVPRWRMVLDKYLAIVLGLIVVAAATWAGAVGGAAASNSALSASDVAAALLMLVLLGLAFASGGLLLSVVTGNRGLAIGGAIGVMVVMYLVDTLAPIVEGLRTLQPLSLFRYYTANDPLSHGLAVSDAGVLAVVAIVLLVASLVAFERRDLAA